MLLGFRKRNLSSLRKAVSESTLVVRPHMYEPQLRAMNESAAAVGLVPDPQPAETLVVRLLSGASLAAKDTTGTSDPYVTLCTVPCGAWPPAMRPVSKSAEMAELERAAGGGPASVSSVAWATLDPVWEDEAFSLGGVDRDGEDLVVRVWDKDRIGRPEFMGQAVLPLSQAFAARKPRHAVLALSSRGFPDEAVSGHIEILFYIVGTTESSIATDAPIDAVIVDAGQDAVRAPGIGVLDGPAISLPREFEVEPPVEDLVGSAVCPEPERADDAAYGPVLEDAPCVLEDPHEATRWVSAFTRAYPPRTPDMFVAESEETGIVAVAVVAERMVGFGFMYWVVAFSKGGVARAVVEDEGASEGLEFPSVLMRAFPRWAHIASLFAPVPRSAGHTLSTLMTLEASDKPRKRCKIGVLFGRAGQVKENSLYSNVQPSQPFVRFCELLGQRVRLRGYKGYAAQLDTANDGSGTHSVAGRLAGYEIMFHVSTLLQYDPTDEQRIQRKRFIGNDIAVIVFIDGTTPYALDQMSSQYTNVVIVVHYLAEVDGYAVSVARKKGVRPFGPPLLPGRVYPATQRTIEVILAKALNGEAATFLAPEFAIRSARTRATYLGALMDELAGHPEAGPRVRRMRARKLPRYFRDGGSPHALSLLDPELVQVPVLGALVSWDEADPLVQLHPLLEAFPFFVRCIASVVPLAHEDAPPRLLFASAKGLFANVLGSATVTKVLDIVFIEQIVVDAEHQLLVVRVGGRRPAVLCFPLLDVLAGVRGSTMYLPVQNPTLVRVGRVQGYPMLFASGASHSQGDFVSVFVLDPESGEFVRLETLHVEGTVTCMAVARGGVLVGANDDGAGRFTFWGWDPTDHQFYPRELGHPQPDDEAIGVFTGLPEGRVLLAYATHAVFASASGALCPEFQLRWCARPLHLGFHAGQILVAYHRTFVEVFSLVSGALLELHPLRTVSAFDCSGPLLFSPSISETTRGPSVVELVCRRPEERLAAPVCMPADPALSPSGRARARAQSINSSSTSSSSSSSTSSSSSSCGSGSSKFSGAPAHRLGAAAAPHTRTRAWSIASSNFGGAAEPDVRTLTKSIASMRATRQATFVNFPEHLAPPSVAGRLDPGHVDDSVAASAVASTLLEDIIDDTDTDSDNEPDSSLGVATPHSLTVSYRQRTAHEAIVESKHQSLHQLQANLDTLGTSLANLIGRIDQLQAPLGW